MSNPADNSPQAPAPRFELFHRLGDPASSRMRMRVVKLGFEQVSFFRNVAFDSHRIAFEERGGHVLPAIWDGTRLMEGESACESFLAGLSPPPA